MLEKQIEKKLVDAVRAAGGMCLKFVSPGMDGMPDRIMLMPFGRMAFVEIKAPGKKPRPLQRFRHDSDHLVLGDDTLGGFFREVGDFFEGIVGEVGDFPKSILNQQITLLKYSLKTIFTVIVYWNCFK